MVKKLVQKMVKKIVQKIVQGFSGPVHILPYVVSHAIFENANHYYSSIKVKEPVTFARLSD